MTMLVTLDDAKAHMRVTQDIEDEDIVAKIEDASAAVLAYITDASFVQTDGTPDDTMPPQCRQATLKLVDSFFRERGGGAGEEWTGDPNYLPRSVVALLYPLRDPTLA